MSVKPLVICVPSKARPEIFKKRTLSILVHTKVPWFVFVEPQDYSSYKEAIPKEYHSNIIRLELNDQGLGYSLRDIKNYALSHRYEFVWKMDDDISHWYQSSRVIDKTHQGVILDGMKGLLTEAKEVLGEALGGLSFPSKFFHNNWDDFTHVNKMLEGMYIIKSKDWFIPNSLKGYHEEFVASAYLLSIGKITLRVGRYCWDADFSSFSGGLQSFDRTTEQDNDFKVLEKEFPELVKYTQRREYPQKTGKVFTVTDKTYFNRMNSVRLSKSALLKSTLQKEIVECLLKFV